MLSSQQNYFRAKNAPTKPNLVTTKQPEGNNDFIFGDLAKAAGSPFGEGGIASRGGGGTRAKNAAKSRFLASKMFGKVCRHAGYNVARGSHVECPRNNSPSQPALPRRTGFSPTGVAVLSWVATAATTLSPAKARRVVTAVVGVGTRLL